MLQHHWLAKSLHITRFPSRVPVPLVVCSGDEKQWDQRKSYMCSSSHTFSRFGRHKVGLTQNSAVKGPHQHRNFAMYAHQVHTLHCALQNVPYFLPAMANLLADSSRTCGGPSERLLNEPVALIRSSTVTYCSGDLPYCTIAPHSNTNDSGLCGQGIARYLPLSANN